jgi:hypothetical protein
MQNFWKIPETVEKILKGDIHANKEWCDGSASQTPINYTPNASAVVLTHDGKQKRSDLRVTQGHRNR